MPPFKKRIYPFIWLVFALVIVPTSNKGQAQSNVAILCDSSFDTSVLSIPDVFPGTYYSMVSGMSDTDSPYRFERITQSGRTQIDAPLTQSQVQSLLPPLVSPNNRFMVFRPYGHTNLTVWDMQTGEVATLALTPDEAYFLVTDIPVYERHLNKLAWVDGNHLLIRMFPEEFNDRQVTATIEITVNEAPLQVSKGFRVEINYPVLPAPPDNLRQRIFLSPQGNYAASMNLVNVMGYGDAEQLQVFDLNSLNIVFDLIPTSAFNATGSPIWSPDESHLFIPIGNASGTQYRFQVAEISIYTGNINTYLWDSLENAFGSEISRSAGFRQIFSPDGNSLAFRIYRTPQNIPYITGLSLTSPPGPLSNTWRGREKRILKSPLHAMGRGFRGGVNA